PKKAAKPSFGHGWVAWRRCPRSIETREGGKEVGRQSGFENCTVRGFEDIAAGEALGLWLTLEPRDEKALGIREAGEFGEIPEGRSIQRKTPAILLEANSQHALDGMPGCESLELCGSVEKSAVGPQSVETSDVRR